MLVYAGAVMVLFLFIIMLLDLKVEERRKFNTGVDHRRRPRRRRLRRPALCRSSARSPSATSPSPSSTNRLEDVQNVGRLLFSNYNLPFQVVGVLLLVATIGVVILSKRELK